MKLALILGLCLLSSPTFADETKEGKFAEVKAQKIANIDKRMATLQELKTCVTAATEKTSFKACHEQHRAKMEALKGERKNMKAQWKSEKKSKKTKS